MEQAILYLYQNGKYSLRQVLSRSDSSTAKEEGLFRVSDSATEVKHIIEQVEKGRLYFSYCIILKSNSPGQDVDFFQLNRPHVAAQFLKCYLRELPTPLIPERSFEVFLSIDGNNPCQRVISHLAP